MTDGPDHTRVPRAGDDRLDDADVGAWLTGLQRDARRTPSEIADRAQLDLPTVEAALRGEPLDWERTAAVSRACGHTPDSTDRLRWERARPGPSPDGSGDDEPTRRWWRRLVPRRAVVVAALAGAAGAVARAAMAAVRGPAAWVGAHARAAVAVVVALLLVIGLVAWLLIPGAVDRTPTIEACSATSVYADLDGVQECVGRVTDVSTMPASLRPVLASIADENARATNGPVPAVGLAYLLPVPGGEDEDSQAAVVRLGDELAGVWRAQQRANASGAAPRIRVVVYNTGTGGLFWVRVLNDLQNQITTEAHVVAVAGVGSGSGGTGPVSEALTDLRVPVFPARAYAEQLTGLSADPPGLFRLTPTAVRLAATAATRLGQGRAVLVQDVRSDNFDAAGLIGALSDDLGRDPADPSRIGYDSSAGSPSITFTDQLATRCPSPTSGSTAGPRTFAIGGRGPAIADLLVALDASSCPKPLTVVSGPEGAGVLDELRTALRGQGGGRARALLDAFRRGTFRFEYVGLAHPDLLPAPFADLPDPAVLQDGDELLGYDAALTAMACVQRSGAAPLIPSAVLSSCAATVTPARPVDGTAGPIGFDPLGRATSTVVPVVEVRADGTAPMVATGP